jgi:malonyl CoA-acyl carrier protein transacylase
MNSNTKFLFGGQGTAASSTITAEFDTLGFAFARIICFSGTTATLTGSNIVVESETSGGTTNAISGLAATDWTASTASHATSIPKMTYGIDLRGRKRYLKVTFQTATATPAPCIGCELSDVADTVRTLGVGASGSSYGL